MRQIKADIAFDSLIKVFLRFILKNFDKYIAKNPCKRFGGIFSDLLQKLMIGIVI